MTGSKRSVPWKRSTSCEINFALLYGKINLWLR